MTGLAEWLVRDAVQAALTEDLGRGGDLTSAATIRADARARVRIAARQDGRIAGLAFARQAFLALDPDVRFLESALDGDTVAKGDCVLRLEGRTRALLGSERVALNFLGRLSGIATLTHAFVHAVAGTRARIVDTRKTTPGWRAFEKYAVRCGGGTNHRFGLDDGILIKDNHIAAAGGVTAALRSARLAAGHMVRVEIEADTLAQVEEALAEGADAILLDNMDTDTLRRAVAMTAGRATLEASGGVTLATVARIASTGVDLISSGALTHSAPCFDFGLDFEDVI